MHVLKTLSCAALLTLAVSGCASTPCAVPPSPTKPPPAAWLMQPPPNSQQTLDRIISPSAISSP